VKKKPKKIVKLKLKKDSFLFPTTIELCDQVQVAPDNKRITVFKKGISQALKTSIPGGGQKQPIDSEGAKLAEKKSPKKSKKKHNFRQNKK